MALEFIEKRRGQADRYSWMPFEPSENFNPDWWDTPPYLVDDPLYMQVLRDGDEVARIEFGEAACALDHYGVDRGLLSNALEIQFIEISSKYRRQGIGKEIVRELETRHSTRTLLAFSEEADDFWASLGWRRYNHLTEPPQAYRPLFVRQHESHPRT